MLKSKKRYRKALLLQAAEQGKAGEEHSTGRKFLPVPVEDLPVGLPHVDLWRFAAETLIRPT